MKPYRVVSSVLVMDASDNIILSCDYNSTAERSCNALNAAFDAGRGSLASQRQAQPVERRLTEAEIEGLSMQRLVDTSEGRIACIDGGQESDCHGYADGLRYANEHGYLSQPVGAEPVAWQYRWTNPGGDNVSDRELAWKPCEPKYAGQTLEAHIEELRSYNSDGKPQYEVRALCLAKGVQPQPSTNEPTE